MLSTLIGQASVFVSFEVATMIADNGISFRLTLISDR